MAIYIVDKTRLPSFSKGLYFTLWNAALPGQISTLRVKTLKSVFFVNPRPSMLLLTFRCNRKI
jgi:hypothetical protein